MIHKNAHANAVLCLAITAIVPNPSHLNVRHYRNPEGSNTLKAGFTYTSPLFARATKTDQTTKSHAERACFAGGRPKMSRRLG